MDEQTLGKIARLYQLDEIAQEAMHKQSLATKRMESAIEEYREFAADNAQMVIETLMGQPPNLKH